MKSNGRWSHSSFFGFYWQALAPFLITILIDLFISCYLLVGPPKRVVNVMQLTFMSSKFKVFLFAFAIGVFLISWVAEKHLFYRTARVLGKAYTRLWPRYRKQRRQYKVLLEEMTWAQRNKNTRLYMNRIWFNISSVHLGYIYVIHSYRQGKDREILRSNSNNTPISFLLVEDFYSTTMQSYASIYAAKEYAVSVPWSVCVLNSNLHSSSIISFAPFSVPKGASNPTMQGRPSSLGTSAVKQQRSYRSA